MSTIVNVNSPAKAYDYEQLTVSVAAVPFTAAKLKVVAALGAAGGGQATPPLTKTADEVLITVEDNPVRVRFDGVAPTALVGHMMNAGDVMQIVGYENLVNFKAIRQGGADAKISVTFLRRG